MVKV
jgi:hypothetical protein